jgi:hypothetical protein
MMQNEPVGIAWYAREDYPGILEVMDDADLLPPSFEDWLERAEEVERELGRQGFVLLRVALDPADFVVWCRDRRRAPDGDARSAFAAEGAEQQDVRGRRKSATG